MNEEMEPEVLSYRAFQNREALLAWRRRRRAFELRAGARSDPSGQEFMKLPPRAARADVRPPR